MTPAPDETLRGEARARGGTPILLGLVMALAVVLRVFHLDQLSLWNDELFSRYYSDLFDLGYLWGPGLRLEPTPPLYYTLLKAWIALFGDGAAALRSLSVVAGCAAVPLVYAIGREFAPPRQALLAALLFVLSPMAIYFSQETRVYALLVLPAGVVLLGVARFLRDPAFLAGLPAYGVAGVIGLYCHPTFWFLLASAAVVVLLCVLAGEVARRGRAIAAWVAVNALVAFAGLPAALALAGGSSAGAMAWIPKLRARDVAVALSTLVSGVVTDPLTAGAPLAAALLLALAASLWVRPPAWRERVVVLVIPGLFLALVLAVSLDRMILLPRILVWMTVPLALALARGLCVASPVRPVLGALTVAVLAVGVTWQVGFAATAKEPWRDVLGAVAPSLAAADLVVLGPSSDPVVLAYYAPGVAGARLWDNGDPPTIESTAMRARLNVGWIGADAIVAAVAAGKSVWLVANYVDQPAVEGLLARTGPPVLRIDRPCGKYQCVSVLAWGVPPAAP